MSRRLVVTLWFSRECPSHEAAEALLREAASDAGVDVRVVPVEVTTDAHAAALGYVGSPTFLVGGGDLFPVEGPPHAPTHDACRAYRRPDGRIAPLPSREQLARALAAHAHPEAA